MQKIIITVGLPGSGKTTFAEKYVKENLKNIEVNHIEFDKYRVSIFGKKRSLETIYLERTDSKENADVVILDGLFLTNEDIVNVIDMVKDNTIEENLVFEIHYWNADRDTCLYNDRGRREINSENTIKHAKVENLDLEYIKEECNIDRIAVVCHEVEKKSILNLALDESNLKVEDDGYLYSEKWIVGGYTHDRMGTSWNVDVEEPLEFEELDTLLEKLVPNITYLQYKKLSKAVVEKENFDDMDYYHNYQCERWKCKIDELMEYLEDEGLVNV